MPGGILAQATSPEGAQREAVGEVRHPRIVEFMFDAADVQLGKLMTGRRLQGAGSIVGRDGLPPLEAG